MQIDSDLVIYRTTLVRTFQVVTICRVDKSEREGNGAVLVNACERDLLPAINVQAFSVLSSDLLACAKLRRIWSSAKERSAHVRRNLLCVARVLGTDVNAGQLSCSDRCCVRSVFPAFSGLELGESRAFPVPRVLIEKTVHRYVVINEKVGTEEVADAPRVKKTPVKKAVSQKRPAAVEVEVAPVVKKKRTTMGKPVVIAQEKRKRRLVLEAEDEIVDDQPAAEAATGMQEPVIENEQAVTEPAVGTVLVEPIVEKSPVVEPAVAIVVNEGPSTADDVDDIIQQVLTETAQLETTDDGDPVDEPDVSGAHVEDQPAEPTPILHLDGVWAVEPCADQWVKIPQPSVHNEVPRQRSYDDTLPLVSTFFRVLRKQWADISSSCSTGFPFYSPSAYIFALRLSQLCTIFIRYSLFISLTTEDIRSFVGSIASERTVLRSVQSSFVSAVHPSVQLLDERTLSASTSDDSAMNFDETDTAATLPSLLAVTSELSTSLDDLQIFLSERFDNQAEATRHIDDAQSAVLSKLHTIKRDILDALMQQEEAFRILINNARQDGRTLDDFQTLRFNEFRKVVLAQGVSATADLLEVRKEIKALDAKVTSLDEKVAATRNDLLEFRAQEQQTLNIITDQLSELVAYINRGGNEKNGEVSSSRPQPPPDDQNRDSGIAGGCGDTDRNIVERLLTADRQRQRERSRGHSSGSYKRRRY
ncbi:hypothetical protein F511_13107 [Dorcoceras hygrometricum]|uniref:Uncharacterized protein n=1 Tax=Dorcoceras hygrometricum TaxID=472368 RepID=A0A2Z7AZH1_9LAMI|nr:hypothetical protein F511_13107 [Dorcoceras hygrometricum]